VVPALEVKVRVRVEERWWAKSWREVRWRWIMRREASIVMEKRLEGEMESHS